MRPSAPVLLPNLGGEERPGPGAIALPVATPAVAGVVAAWSLAFHPAVRVLGAAVGGWPAELGERPGGAAWGWLDLGRDLVPWLSTAGALEDASRLRLAFAASDPRVVRAVHDKAFAVSTARRLGLEPAELSGASLVLSPEDLRAPTVGEALAAHAGTWGRGAGGRATLKPRWGTAGRGRLGVETSALADLQTAGLARLARRGGAILEPWLDRVEDLSAQYRIRLDGTVELLGTVRQVVRRAGVFLGCRGLVGTDGECRAGSVHDAEVAGAGARVAAEAASQGLAGPCGVDAFAFREAGGSIVLRPVVELNARFTVGTVALGVLARCLGAGWLEPPAAWLFTPAPPAELIAAARASPSARSLELAPGSALLVASDAVGVIDALVRRAWPRAGSCESAAF